MSTSGIVGSLFSRTKNLLLKELALAPDTPVHLRELSRRTGLDPTGISRELRALVKSGIVLVRHTGNLNMYTLNRRCPIYHELRMIMLKTSGLADQISDSLRPLASRIERAYIYGSIASGNDTSDSDVDLMVVGTVSLVKVVQAVSKPGRELRRVINPTVMNPEEYRKRKLEKNSFVQQLEAKDKIMLIGEEDES